jgi:hypothetical protein
MKHELIKASREIIVIKLKNESENYRTALIPYTEDEARNANNGQRHHLQTVRQDNIREVKDKK